MVDYKKLLKEYKTPLYVYDSDELKSRVNYVKSKLNMRLKQIHSLFVR